YVNKWSKLGIGRVRYGVMCTEDGVVFDDGVTGRLGPEHYLMSTTSSGAAAVWEWLENVLQTMHPDWAVHVTPVTTAYASMTGARLVGLQPDDGSLVPPEASQIVDGSRIAGRVMSSRMSPTLGRSICLAQVEASLAAPGTQVTVRLPGGRLIGARVTEHLAHVD